MNVTSFSRLHPSLALTVGVGVAAITAFVLGGPLNPPAGPVTSTYKTLTEVEPRIAINATNTPGTATALFRITLPGSYYLTGNVAGVVGKHGIEIAVAAGNSQSVTIDLMGYALAASNGSLDGISVTVANTLNGAVRNGTVRNWGGDGVDVSNSTNNLLEDLRVSNNGGRGIAAGSAATVTGCTASLNTGDGISASNGSTVTGCTASSNTGNGITANSFTTISFCSVTANLVDGIAVNNRCYVLTNQCGGTLAAPVLNSTGIHVFGNANRIEGNTLTGNHRGLDVDFTGNLIVRNAASSNTINWDISIGGNRGEFVGAAGGAAFAGSTGGSPLGSTDPWVNFSY